MIPSQRATWNLLAANFPVKFHERCHNWRGTPLQLQIAGTSASLVGQAHLRLDIRFVTPRVGVTCVVYDATISGGAPSSRRQSWPYRRTLTYMIR